MQLYRVFPHVPGARRGQPGHGLHLDPDPGGGRWDNPDLYRAGYFATSPEGAIGESFARMTTWQARMLRLPAMGEATRALGRYRFDEEVHPLLDLDDAANLLDRGLRPTRVVWRNRPATQAVAAAIFGEGRWSGLTWWSLHRPQWTLVCLWDIDGLELERVEPIPGHPGLIEAADRLARPLTDDLVG